MKMTRNWKSYFYMGDDKKHQKMHVNAINI